MFSGVKQSYEENSARVAGAIVAGLPSASFDSSVSTLHLHAKIAHSRRQPSPSDHTHMCDHIITLTAVIT